MRDPDPVACDVSRPEKFCEKFAPAKFFEPKELLRPFEDIENVRDEAELERPVFEVPGLELRLFERPAFMPPELLRPAFVRPVFEVRSFERRFSRLEELLPADFPLPELSDEREEEPEGECEEEAEEDEEERTKALFIFSRDMRRMRPALPLEEAEELPCRPDVRDPLALLLPKAPRPVLLLSFSRPTTKHFTSAEAPREASLPRQRKPYYISGLRA